MGWDLVQDCAEAGVVAAPMGWGSGCSPQFAWRPRLEVLPGLADVIQPCLLQVQGEFPVGGVMHQLRVGGTAHLGGRGGQPVTHERQQLVADDGRGDRGRGPPLELPTWTYRAPTLAWLQGSGSCPSR